ncbi:MAG: 2-dehydropantoate 2-reductase, partial [Nitrososphaerales archaeon]|nr:2-dehydropantoate 2-reductase [Nitrososphaerales archaeon]
MRIAILGAGAIGCLFAALLTEGGEHVTLIDRRFERAKLISEEGLKIYGVSGERIIRVDVVTDPRMVKGPDLVIVAVKSYDTDTAIERILPIIHEKTVILTLQNGLGNVEKIVSKVGIEHVLAGVTTEASTVINYGEIYHAAKGITIIGELNGNITERVQNIVNIFNRSNIEAKVSFNIQSAIWEKVLINVGINALSAITGMRNGELLNVPEIKEIMIEAVKEGLRVTKVIGVKLENDVIKSMLSVAERTRLNKSSMLQDIERGSKTEIDSLNGAIVRLGHIYGIPTPINDA